ncbi:MAG TPA: nicotinate phosphoribosyltransferase [Trueperaceae bacterium]|nr:nicotinate phosphoribosyltransferase [Trueperaceae bacterium]
MSSQHHPPVNEGILFADLYELTMAQLYLRTGMHDTPSQFNAFYRHNPDFGGHQAGYCVTAGLEDLLAWMERARPTQADLDALATLRNARGGRLFDDAFLEWLRAQGGFPGVRVLAPDEGRVVHPNAPFAIVEGPLASAQLLETALLNHLNYPTLIATRATRIKQAARGAPVVDFGMRRGHARGVNAGSRAALIGGLDGTSNTGEALVLGAQPKGTHAHSLVQAFMAAGMDELDAFRAYAETYPDDCLLLLDTVDTLHSGLPNAITVFEELRKGGHEPRGVRLDSGDLAHLAIQVAKELDRAGFQDVPITLSNQLDELTIWQILEQIEGEAPRYDVAPQPLIARLGYGVGTRLLTSHGAPALDGVYKLVALEHDGAWAPTIKRSDTLGKATTPGPKRVFRVYDSRGMATADLVTLAHEEPRRDAPLRLRHPVERTSRTLQPDEIGGIEPLMQLAWADGARTGPAVDLTALRERRRRDEERLDPGVRRLINPHIYHVSLSDTLWRLKQDLLTGPNGADPQAGG